MRCTGKSDTVDDMVGTSDFKKKARSYDDGLKQHQIITKPRKMSPTVRVRAARAGRPTCSLAVPITRLRFLKKRLTTHALPVYKLRDKSTETNTKIINGCINRSTLILKSKKSI